VGVVQSGHYPVSETNEILKGKLKGGEIISAQFYTRSGWIVSSAEIEHPPNKIDLITNMPDNNIMTTTLRKK
jgi:hypothetical protein